MPETSKLATPAFVGFSLSIAALFIGFTKPEAADIAVMLTLYGIVIVMIEAIKHHGTAGKVFYGCVVPAIWSVIITFTSRNLLVSSGYKDTSNPDEYIYISAQLAISAMFTTMIALLAVEVWDENHQKFRNKFPRIPVGLAGNHVGFVMSGAFLFAIYFVV